MSATVRIDKDVIDFIARYGGRCRECADCNGICEHTGLPCARPDEAIRHVLTAYNYGVEHGFIVVSSYAPNPEETKP